MKPNKRKMGKDFATGLLVIFLIALGAILVPAIPAVLATLSAIVLPLLGAILLFVFVIVAIAFLGKGINIAREKW